MKLLTELGVRSVEDLRRAAKSGRLRAFRGFGPKLEQNILAALAKPVAEKRFKLPVAEAEANSLVKVLSNSPDHGHIVVAGSYRRRRDTVGDLDVLATTPVGAAIGDNLVAFSWLTKTAPRSWRMVRRERRSFCVPDFRSTCGSFRRRVMGLP